VFLLAWLPRAFRTRSSRGFRRRFSPSEPPPFLGTFDFGIGDLSRRGKTSSKDTANFRFTPIFPNYGTGPLSKVAAPRRMRPKNEPQFLIFQTRGDTYHPPTPLKGGTIRSPHPRASRQGEPPCSPPPASCRHSAFGRPNAGQIFGSFRLWAEIRFRKRDTSRIPPRRLRRTSLGWISEIFRPMTPSKSPRSRKRPFSPIKLLVSPVAPQYIPFMSCFT